LTTGGTAGQFLAFNSGAAPTWSSISVADISDLAANYVRKFGTPQTVSSETSFFNSVGLNNGLTLDTSGDYKLTLYRRPGVGGVDSFVIVPQDTTDTGPLGLYAHDFFIYGQPNSNPTANGGGNLSLDGGAGPSRALSGNVFIGNGITQAVRIGNLAGNVYLDGPATFFRPAQFASTFTFNMLSGYVKANGISDVSASSTIPVSDVSGAAPISSPTFTGTVTLPLTIAGYVKTSSAGVISSSASVPTGDLSGAVALANGGTNASLTATAGGSVYGTGTALAVTAAGLSGQFLQSNGAAAPTWADVTASAPYDLRGMFVGNPASSAIIDRFVADRAATISTTSTNHKFSAGSLPSAGSVILTVQRTRTTLGVPSTVTVFTATSSSTDTILNGYYPMTISAVTNGDLIADDVLEVVMQAGAVDASFATPVFTISAVA
jgi:hypothetical protein